MLKRKNKKGGIIAIFYVLITLLSLAIGFLVLAYVAPLITTELRGSDIGDVPEAAGVLNKTDELVVGTVNAIYLIIFVLILIGIIISGFLIHSHPVFIPIFIILLGIAVVLGVIFSNVYEKISEETVMNETAATHTYSKAIMDRLPIIILIIGIIVMVIIFSKIFGGSPPV